MNQIKIDFESKPAEPILLKFDGPAYDSQRDDKRLSSQFWTILELMSDGQWRTLQQIAALTSYPESSISAQLRHMRKKRFGQHTVERQHVKGGLFEYRVTINDKERGNVSV